MRIGIITDPPTVVHSCAVVGGQLAKHLVKLGQEVHLLGYNYRGDILEHRDGYRLHPDKPQPPVGELSVRAFLERTRVQVLYAHAVPGVFGGAISASRNFGVPFLPHTFFYLYAKARRQKQKMSERPDIFIGEIGTVDEFIACNSFTLGVGLSMGKRVWHLPTGVETSIFCPKGGNYRRKIGLKASDFVVLFSGTNNAIKDPEGAILAFHQFQRGKSDVYLAMHTRPVEACADLRALVSELRLQKRIRFFTDFFPEWLAPPWSPTYPRENGSPPYTTTPYHEMPFVYRTGEVQIVTSRKEGMSTTILEGMACGLPTVCSDDPIVSEPVIPYQTGITVPREETGRPGIEGLANALEYFYLNRAELRRMARNAAELARIRHDWHFIARRLLDIFALRLGSGSETRNAIQKGGPKG